MRAAETQRELLRELNEMGNNDDDDVHGLFVLVEEVADEGDALTAPIDELVRSHGGQRLTIADLERTPGMGMLGTHLDKSASCTTLASSSFDFQSMFERGAMSVLLTACASASFLGQPLHDCTWCTDGFGRRQLGWTPLVVRMLCGVIDDFAVVRRLREVPFVLNCCVSRSGCKRVAWDFAIPTSEWPVLVLVPLVDVLRIENVVPDFLDLGDRHGLHAILSNVSDTAADRHAQRFFTNRFFPFTSRALNPSN